MPGIAVMDYDEGGYDYRNFWRGRDFEHRTETVALSRLLPRLLPEGRADWFVDLGGGFGRHLPTYRRFARRVVLVDRSLTNLRNAAADPPPPGSTWSGPTSTACRCGTGPSTPAPACGCSTI
jgi:hypothetical protein